MSYALGIDIGTSYTAAGFNTTTASSTAPPEVLPLGRNTVATPSVVTLDDDLNVLVGDAAVRRAVERPDRVVREFKRRIGDEVPYSIGDVDVAAEDIYAIVAEWVVERAAERLGERPATITMTHPATWGEFRIGLVRDALAARGLAHVELLTEPEAAAMHYATKSHVEPGAALAVYDFGGGTFDAAVLRGRDDGTFETLGTPEGIDHLGGADFDQAVLDHVDAHVDGALSAVDPNDPAQLLALSRARRECTEAKEALSFDTAARIPVLLTETNTSVRLVRAEFEAMIDARVRETVEVLRRAIASSRLEPEALSAIVLIGGSSRIPLAAQLLSAEFERPIAIDADPKTSICLGAAFAAAHRTASAAPTRTLVTAMAPPIDIGTIIYGSKAAADAAAAPRPPSAPQAVAALPWYRRRRARGGIVAAATTMALLVASPAIPMDGTIGSLLGSSMRAAGAVSASSTGDTTGGADSSGGGGHGTSDEAGGTSSSEGASPAATERPGKRPAERDPKPTPTAPVESDAGGDGDWSSGASGGGSGEGQGNTGTGDNSGVTGSTGNTDGDTQGAPADPTATPDPVGPAPAPDPNPDGEPEPEPDPVSEPPADPETGGSGSESHELNPGTAPGIDEPDVPVAPVEPVEPVEPGGAGDEPGAGVEPVPELEPDAGPKPGPAEQARPGTGESLSGQLRNTTEVPAL